MGERQADVSADATAVLKAIAERLGSSLEEVSGGTVDTHEAAKSGMDWESFCTVSDALMERAGSGEALATHGACAITVPELGSSIRILRTVVGCQGLYWANFRWGGPSLFRTVKTTFVVRRDGTYVGTISLPEGARHCDAFFHINQGVFRTLPKVLGLAEARIVLRISPGFGSYEIEPPPSRSWISNARWIMRAMLSSSELVDRLADQNLRLTEERREADQARADAVDARHRAEESLRIADERRKEAEAARITAEAARSQADEALRIRGEFVGTVSHELRTPLNGILGMSQILLNRPLPRDVREQITTIATSGRVLLGLINELLDFSKIDAGRLTLDPQPTDLRAVVEQVVTNCSARAAGRPLDVVGHVAPDVPDVVIIDGNRLRQVLANLTDNAVKFTPSGSVLLKVTYSPGGLAVSVTDTGIGISEADCQRIFQPFVQADGSTTRRFGGTGLGLSIAQALVGLMGGAITVESRVGSGSTFAFPIPMTVPPAPRSVDRFVVGVIAREPVRSAWEAMLLGLGFGVGLPPRVWLVDTDTGLVPPPGPERCIFASRDHSGGDTVLRKPVGRVELMAAMVPIVETRWASVQSPGNPVDLAVPAVAPVRGLRVRLIDDDPVHHALTSRHLRRMGHALVEEDPADLVIVCAEAEGLDPAASRARGRWPQSRVLAMLRPVEPADLAAVFSG